MTHASKSVSWHRTLFRIAAFVLEFFPAGIRRNHILVELVKVRLDLRELG
jgi:hypothetical protein